MYDKSDSTCSVSFITQGNALRRSVEEKQKEVDKLSIDIDAQKLVLQQKNVTQTGTLQTVHSVKCKYFVSSAL